MLSAHFSDPRQGLSPQFFCQFTLRVWTYAFRLKDRVKNNNNNNNNTPWPSRLPLFVGELTKKALRCRLWRFDSAPSAARRRRERRYASCNSILCLPHSFLSKSHPHSSAMPANLLPFPPPDSPPYHPPPTTLSTSLYSFNPHFSFSPTNLIIRGAHFLALSPFVQILDVRGPQMDQLVEVLKMLDYCDPRAGFRICPTISQDSNPAS